MAVKRCYHIVKIAILNNSQGRRRLFVAAVEQRRVDACPLNERDCFSAGRTGLQNQVLLKLSLNWEVRHRVKELGVGRGH